MVFWDSSPLSSICPFEFRSSSLCFCNSHFRKSYSPFLVSLQLPCLPNSLYSILSLRSQFELLVLHKYFPLLYMFPPLLVNFLMFLNYSYPLELKMYFYLYSFDVDPLTYCSPCFISSIHVNIQWVLLQILLHVKFICLLHILKYFSSFQ